MERLRDIFLQNIRREAERLDLSYGDVADRAGLSRSGIYKIMQGDREPGFDNIERIAKALQCDPYRLLLTPGQLPAPSPTEALEIVGKALQRGVNPTPSVASSLHPSLARLIAAVDADPSLIEDVDIILDALAAVNEEEARSTRKAR